MARTYQSVTAKLRAFFAANPDEWLSVDDVMTKFGTTYWSARKSLSECKAVRISVYHAAPHQKQVSNQVSEEVSKT